MVAELEQDKADIGQGVRKLDSLLLMRKWGPAVIEPDDVLLPEVNRSQLR